MTISLIVPTYNEETNIGEFYSEVKLVSEQLVDCQFEFVFIDDGSNDRSFELLTQLRANDRRVHIIKFSRNFGSHSAIYAGLERCHGEVALIIPVDLQDPPGSIHQFIERWQQGYKVIWGIRKSRPGEDFFLEMCSRLYYKMLNSISDLHLPGTGVDMVLLDRQVIDIVNKIEEKNSSYVLLISWLGFSQSGIEFDRRSRTRGRSKWTFSKRLKLFLDSMVSFSYVPLRFMSIIGVGASLVGLLYAAIVTLSALTGNPAQGWASLIVGVLIIGGLQMVMLGILGEYLWRAYDETRARPRYVIESSTLSGGR